MVEVLGIDILFIIVGVLGGLARACFGFLKTLSQGFEVNLRYFVVTLLISGLIGGMLGAVFDMDFRVAALAGYVGTDILDNIFKGTLGASILIKKR